MPLRLAITALLLVASAACARPTRLTQPQPRDQLYASLVGQWRGTLEYRDEAHPDRLVTRSTVLEIVPAPDEDGLELRYTFDDGPGRVVQAIDHLHFDRSMQHARWGGVQDTALQRFSVVTRAGGENGAPVHLVLEGEAADGARPTRIRETVEVSAGAVRLLKETQSACGAFAVSHAYALTRAQ